MACPWHWPALGDFWTHLQDRTAKGGNMGIVFVAEIGAGATNRRFICVGSDGSADSTPLLRATAFRHPVITSHKNDPSARHPHEYHQQAIHIPLTGVHRFPAAPTGPNPVQWSTSVRGDPGFVRAWMPGPERWIEYPSPAAPPAWRRLHLVWARGDDECRQLPIRSVLFRIRSLGRRVDLSS